MRRLWLIVLAIALAAIPGRTQQAAPPVDEPVPADQLSAKKISPPKLIFNVDPEFSDEARRKHISGICLVSLIVDTGGNPQNMHIKRCTDPSFEENSLKAVEQFRFNPATTQEGKPVSVYAAIEINYRLYESNGHSKDPFFPIRYELSTSARHYLIRT